MTLWIALLGLIVVYAVVYRRFFLSKSMLIICGGSGYYIAMQIVSKVQESLWRTGRGNELRNASVSISVDVNWFSLRTWKAWVSIIIGQLNTVNLVTGGLVVVILFLMWFFSKNGF